MPTLSSILTVLPLKMNRVLGQAGVPIQGNQENQAGQGQWPAVFRDKPFALQDVALPGTLNLSNGTLETINTLRAGEGLPPMEWAVQRRCNKDRRTDTSWESRASKRNFYNAIACRRRIDSACRWGYFKAGTVVGATKGFIGDESDESRYCKSDRLATAQRK